MLKKGGLGWRHRGLLQGSIAAFSWSDKENHMKQVSIANNSAAILTTISRFQTYSVIAKHRARRLNPDSVIELSCV
jgi:hypothetical protein